MYQFIVLKFVNLYHSELHNWPKKGLWACVEGSNILVKNLHDLLIYYIWEEKENRKKTKSKIIYSNLAISVISLNANSWNIWIIAAGCKTKWHTVTSLLLPYKPKHLKNYSINTTKRTPKALKVTIKCIIVTHHYFVLSWLQENKLIWVCD